MVTLEWGKWGGREGGGRGTQRLPHESKITGVYSSKNARVIITWKKLGFITTLTRRRSSTQLFKVKWHGRAPSQDWPYFTPSVHSSMPSQWAWSPLVTPPDWLAVDKIINQRGKHNYHGASVRSAAGPVPHVTCPPHPLSSSSTHSHYTTFTTLPRPSILK